MPLGAMLGVENCNIWLGKRKFYGVIAGVITIKEETYTKKTKTELKTMANEISAQYGCFLNVTEVGKVLGISRETARKLVSNLPCAEIGNTNKCYIYDVLEFVYK